MKRITLLVIILLSTLTVIAPASAAPGNPGTCEATITLVNPPADGTLVLEIGQSYTFEVHVETVETFHRAQAALEEQYPGRSVHVNANASAPAGTSATLFLTVTGRRSTADLPNGVAPVMIVAGARCSNGRIGAAAFPFNIQVN